MRVTEDHTIKQVDSNLPICSRYKKTGYEGKTRFVCYLQGKALGVEVGGKKYAYCKMNVVSVM